MMIERPKKKGATLQPFLTLPLTPRQLLVHLYQLELVPLSKQNEFIFYSYNGHSRKAELRLIVKILT